MYKLFKIMSLVAVTALATSCSGPGEAHQYDVNDLEFSMEGPLFAGQNSAQVQISIDLEDMLQDTYVEGMEVSDAVLLSATVRPNDTLGFDNINSVVLSFASDNEDVEMQEVAYKNPIDANAAMAELEIASDLDLGELMDEDRVYVVLDADLMEDYWDGNRDFKLDFTLELTIK